MVLATIFVPAPYARQFRDVPERGPSDRASTWHRCFGPRFFVPIALRHARFLAARPCRRASFHSHCRVVGQRRRSPRRLVRTDCPRRDGPFSRIALAIPSPHRSRHAAPRCSSDGVRRHRFLDDGPAGLAGLGSRHLLLPRAASEIPISCSSRAPRGANPRGSFCATSRQISARSSTRNS